MSGHIRLDVLCWESPRRPPFHLHSGCWSGVLPWRYSGEQTPQVSVHAEFDGTGASSYPPAVRSVAPLQPWTTPGVLLVYHPTDESDLRSAEQQLHQPHGVVVIWFFPSSLVQRSSTSCWQYHQLNNHVDPASSWVSSSSSLSRYVTVSCPVVRQFTCLMVRFNKVWVNRICLVNCTKDGGGLILAVWWVVKYRYTAEPHPLAERHDTAGRHLAAAYSYTVERHRLVERHDTVGRHLAAAYSYTVERYRATGREYTAVQRPTTARWNTAACRHTGIREDDVAAYAAGSGWLRMTDYVYIARWLTSLKVIEKRTVIYSSDRIYACALASYTTPPNQIKSTPCVHRGDIARSIRTPRTLVRCKHKEGLT